MKLIIQIPCYNEEQTLPVTLADLPKKIEGIDEIEVLIINDGSTDKTAEVAKKHGVDHIISFKRNRGLAKSFEAGIQFCLKNGADIIANTDGDNQYFGADIEKLVAPILRNEADVVIGDRQPSKIAHFSFFKRQLQRLGTTVTNRLAKTNIQDAVSGFRAFNREAAKNLNILTNFSYTTESLIQLGHNRFAIISVPIRTNKNFRPSRLFKSIPHFLGNQASTILRVYTHNKALKIFSLLGILITLPGIFGIIRFLIFYFQGRGGGLIQSLVLSVMLILLGIIVIVAGILADMISNNRKLLEKILLKLLNNEEEKNSF